MEADWYISSVTLEKPMPVFDRSITLVAMRCSRLESWKTQKVSVKFGYLQINAYLRTQNEYLMANWYDKYLSIYGKPFSEVPQEIIDGTRERLAALQSENPIASIVVIGIMRRLICRLVYGLSVRSSVNIR